MTCDRRVVLKTLGIASAGCLVGCGPGGGGPAEGKATMCGSDLCVSIAENAELAEPGGGLLFTQASGHKIYVVRTASGFSCVTAICTHANCTIEWDGVSSYECPCHGSKFNADGVATMGPAFRPLRVYTSTLAGDVLTIALT